MSETSIRLSEATRNRLRSAKRGSETYDDLLNDLLDEADRPALSSDQARQQAEADGG